MFTFQKFYLNACLIITVMKKIILYIIQCFFHQSAQWQIQTFGLPENLFWPFGPHFGKKMGGGGGGAAVLSPGSATAAIPPQSIIH